MLTEVELIPAEAENHLVLENLLQLYMHDFSEILPIDVGEDGRYNYSKLRLYQSEASRWAFLARIERKLAGFVMFSKLFDEPGDQIYDINEFFILRRYRRCGIGRELAKKVWLSFPGRWQVRVMTNNTVALRFWDSTIRGFTRQIVEEPSQVSDGTAWHVFTFDSSPQQSR